MELNTKENDQAIIFSMPDEITGDNVPQLNEIIHKKLIETGKHIILDLSETNIIDSSGIGIVIRMEKELSSQGRKIILANCSRTVEKIIYMCRLNSIIQLAPSVKKAMEIL